MKKGLLRGLQLVMVAVIVFAIFKVGDYYHKDRVFADQYAALQASDPVQKADPLDVETGAGVVHRASQAASERVLGLQASYPQVVGWITIPDTRIDYPIVQGEDNFYYLDHDFTGAYHPFGAIFLEKDNQPDFSDRNSILYGHNVQTGKQFHDIMNYRDPAFADSHRRIYVSDAQGLHTYEVFALYEADPYDNFRSPAYSDEDWATFMDRMVSRNLLDEEIPDDLSRFLTLQTCKNDDVRMVLHATEVTLEG